MNKIAAIKIVRDTTNLGLKESKDLVEAVMPHLQMSRVEVYQRFEAVRNDIRDFVGKIWSGMDLDTAKKLVRLVEEREFLTKLF